MNADRRPRHPAQRGSAVVWVLIVLVIGWSGGATLLTRTHALAARHTAASAADLAALAVADRVLLGPGPACTAAAEVAAAHRATLRRCVLDAPAGSLGALPLAEVVVAVPLRGALRGLPPAVARARAGPAPLPAPVVDGSGHPAAPVP